MAVSRLPTPEIGALRCILCSIVDRIRAFFAVSSFYCLLSVAGIAADVQVNPRDHNVPDQDNFTTQNEPSLAVAGSLVVVGYNSTKPVGNRFQVSQFAFSTDGGATFMDGGFVPANGNRSLGGDPALAFGPDGTTLYYASIGKETVAAKGNKRGKKKDKQKGGQTSVSRIFVSPSTSLNPVVKFGAPVAISGRTSGAAQDKELIAVDTTQSAFRGRVYVAWSEFPDPNSLPDGPSRVLFAASSSTTPLAFSATQVLSPLSGVPTVNNHGAMPTVAPNGDVYVVWGVFTRGTAAAPQTVQIVRSTDGGASFQNPDPADAKPSKTIASVTSTVGRMCDKVGTPPSCPDGLNIRTRGFPYIAIDQTPPGSPTRGNIYVVFQATPPAPATGRSQIFFTRTTDRGKSWDTPRSISNGPVVTLNGDPTQNDNWIPSIAVSPVTGHIRVVFYSRREDPQNIDIRVYDAGSTDAGLTWFNRPRSTIAFRPSTGYDSFLNLACIPPGAPSCERARAHMGDYISVAAAGSNFYAAWTDTQNKCTPPSGAPKPCSPPGRGDQDVFFSIDADQ